MTQIMYDLKAKKPNHEQMVLIWSPHVEGWLCYSYDTERKCFYTGNPKDTVDEVHVNYWMPQPPNPDQFATGVMN